LTLLSFSVFSRCGYKSKIKKEGMALQLNNFALQSLALRPARAQRSPKFSMTSSPYSGGAREVNVNVVRRMAPEKIEIFKSMEDWVKSDILTLLKPVEKAWQPQDFLPNPTSDGFAEQVNELRERTKDIPDDYFVVIVGDMITEEALPTYQALINGTEIFHDETGSDNTPWATWARGWSAEENRHGDLLNKYLYLSGRVDMKQIEKTTHYLIGSGMVRYICNKSLLLCRRFDACMCDGISHPIKTNN